MARMSKLFVRTVLPAMVFQLVCTAFLAVAMPQGTVSGDIAFSKMHASVAVPLLLKDNDENENTESLSDVDAAALLDLSRHSNNLTAFHGSKLVQVIGMGSLTSLSLFKRFCTLLI